MKLKQLYNEIKLVPPNKLLLKSEKGVPFININNKWYPSYSQHYLGGQLQSYDIQIKDRENIQNILSSLDSKKIPYEYNSYPVIDVVNVSFKYIYNSHKNSILDINEIKLLSPYYMKVFNLALQIKSNIVKISNKEKWEDVFHSFNDLLYVNYGINSPTTNSINTRFGQELKLLSNEELKELYDDLNLYFKSFI